MLFLRTLFRPDAAQPQRRGAHETTAAFAAPRSSYHRGAAFMPTPRLPPRVLYLIGVGIVGAVVIVAVIAAAIVLVAAMFHGIVPL